MEGAPGSHYLVFLVPGAGNLILTVLFTFRRFGEQAFNVKRMCGRRPNTEHYRKVPTEVDATDWAGLLEEYKSERTSDRD